VYLDGERVGLMDRRNRSFKVRLPERQNAARLDVLVEAAGRVNFGVEIHDHKGVIGGFTLAGAGEATALTGWQIYNLPLDAKMLGGLKYGAPPARPGPAFWRARVEVAHPGDTFLDMRPWGKGVAWVNGHCLGRFWNIGPAQTLYVPGPWLKPGRNEVVILDLLGPEKPVVAGLETPILDQLRPELDLLGLSRQ